MVSSGLPGGRVCITVIGQHNALGEYVVDGVLAIPQHFLFPDRSDISVHAQHLAVVCHGILGGHPRWLSLCPYIFPHGQRGATG